MRPKGNINSCITVSYLLSLREQIYAYPLHARGKEKITVACPPTSQTMKRSGRSESISEDCGSIEHVLLANAEVPDLSIGANTDDEIAEIVDVINNDSSLLPSGIADAYNNVSRTSHSESQKIKLAKRPRPDVVLPKQNYNLICERLVGTLHMPIQTPKMGRDKKDTRTTCGICGAKTTIKCSHCGVGMNCLAELFICLTHINDSCSLSILQVSISTVLLIWHNKLFLLKT